MPSAAVLAAVQALNGAVGAGGGALSVIDYYPMQEPVGISAVYDAMTGAAAGEWVGPPQLRGTYGPAENDTPSYAVKFLPSNPNQQYARLDSGPRVMGALNGGGLFVCVAIKHASGADRDTILSASDPTGFAGFRIALNQGGIGEYSSVSESVLFGTNIAGGSSACTGMLVNGDLLFDDQWHLHMWYLKGSSTVKHWIDGVPKPLIVASNGTGSVYPTVGAKLVAGATTFGPYTDGSPAYAFNGAMSDLILIEGEPTQTQMRDICRAMYYTVRGIPGVVAHYRPGPGGAFANVAMTTPSVEGGPILALRDLSGHGNDAKYDHPVNVPTLERAINGGRWCASFDNFTSNYSQWGPDGLCRQQTLAVGPTSTRLVQSHMGCLVSSRTLASTCFAKGQKIVSFIAGGIDYNSLRLSNDEPCVERDSGYIYAIDIPKARCMPSLGILGFTSGLRGDFGPGDAVFVNNRWQSPAAAPFNTGNMARQYITQWYLPDFPGQFWFGGGQNMWSGWIEETIITRCPYLPEEAAAYVSRTFAEAGEPLNPKFHVCVVGDSIPSGNQSNKNLTMLGGALPVEARRVASFTSASISALRVRSETNASLSMTNRGLQSPKWWEPGAKNIAAVEAVVNDSIDGDSEATFGADIDVLIPQLRAGGAHVVLWNEETSNGIGPGPTPRNLAIRSRLASGDINGIVILTPLYPGFGLGNDGLHPTPEGQAVWADDWWTQGLSPYLRPTRADPPTQSKRSGSER